MAKARRDPSSRGDATRQALIEAATELFGREGFHGTSNRHLAATARTNQALIGYHFGNKRGLYLAVFEHIAARMGQRLGPVVEAIRSELDTLDEKSPSGEPVEPVARETLLGLLHRLLEGFVAMITAEESAKWARLIVREQQDPTEAFDILYQGVMGKVLSLMARLIAGMRPGPQDSMADRLLALTLLGQAIGFRVARASAVRYLDWERIGPEEVAAIQKRIRRNTTAILKEEVGG